MTREACSFCGTVVSTTADPNDVEGWFVSLEELEKLEVEIQADDAYHLSGLVRRICPTRLVVCADCRKLLPASFPESFTEVDATSLGLDTSKIKGDSLTNKFVNILEAKWPDSAIDGDKDNG